MHLPSSRLRPALLLLAFGLASTPAAAIQIEYQALDLPDVVPGTDRWQYGYTVTGGGFVAFGGLNLLYDPARYASLVVSTEPDASDWFTPSLVIDPDPGLPADGVVTLTAQLATDTASFVVDVDWLGTGTPGAQPFEGFDDFFTVIATGSTVLPGAVTLAEPGGLALLMLGGVLPGLGRRRRPRT